MSPELRVQLFDLTTVLGYVVIVQGRTRSAELVEGFETDLVVCPFLGQ